MRFQRTISLTACLCFVFLAGIASAKAPKKVGKKDGEKSQGKYVVYVSLSGEKRIAVYKMDPSSGKLSSLASIDVGGAPGSLAVDPQRRYLYASIRSIESVATLRIDAKTGRLSPLGATRVAGNPVYVATDRTGRFLLTAYYGGDKVAVYPIAKDGKVRGEATQILNTGRHPHSINIDAANRTVFVPNTGADRIMQFKFDPDSGLLALQSVPLVKTKSGAGPRHFFFHPKQDFVYVVNETNSSVTAYKLDRKAGALTAFQTLSTLPPDFKGRNSCADIEITPSGKYLYASNRGHDSLAGFLIDEKTGRLTPLGQTPTEKTPREFNIDPSGRFIYSAGQASGKMAAYRIDPSTGKLRRFATYAVGKGPAWVLAVKLNEN